MIVTSEQELSMLKQVGQIVAETLHHMLQHVRPGITTKSLDLLGETYLATRDARSAPQLTYDFPGATCISVNEVVAHGIPSAETILQEGDVINIDVSAEWCGYWADNGASVVVGKDIHGRQKLVDCSLDTLQSAVARLRSGSKIQTLGAFIEHSANAEGFRVIKNLGGHGLGRALHEEPTDILNFRDILDKRRFRKGTVVAIETFFNTQSWRAVGQADGFTLVGNRGGVAVQHEVSIVITDTVPIILTPILYKT
ncbi:type I methionyl aminopeptidase [Sphingobacterium suaedae]|uniref:Methionine aminopeptidase n=1 Tax=Sphingobacterium suaedae TaxID=1686402 RepID=A0ABW5KI04_9SPHI